MVKLGYQTGTIEFVTSKRIVPWPRAQFMVKHVLIAIICRPVFWGGLKPPLSHLCYRDKRRRRLAWQDLSGRFKSTRAFFLFLAYNVFILYIISFLCYLQTRAMDQLVGRWLGKRWDLGSNPRSPQIISIILFQMFPCSARPRAHHASQRLGLTSGIKTNLKARTCSTWCTLVSKQAHDQKKKSTWPLS